MTPSWERIVSELTEDECRAGMPQPRTRGELEREYGQVWAEDEALAEFELQGFVTLRDGVRAVAKRKSDGVRGTLRVQDSPRLFWGWARG